MSAARAIRVGALVVALVLVAGGSGWIPFRPAVAVGVLAIVLAAGEILVALRAPRAKAPSAPVRSSREVLLDTSALIDGRLPQIAESGFLDFELLVPQFVLRELQHVADASDAVRRARGRRGLDVLAALQSSSKIRVRLLDDDPSEERSVDLKLVALARHRGAALLTTDVALNKVAGIRDVPVLNLNALAHALRPQVLPGERMRVTIVKEGKEAGQGVAYLEDGTMVVVDEGRSHTGRAIEVVVTGAIQTAAGKMFFARLASDSEL